MTGAVSGCRDHLDSHRWSEVGTRRVCRGCHLIDFSWSLSRRQMLEALRVAGGRSGDPG